MVCSRCGFIRYVVRAYLRLFLLPRASKCELGFLFPILTTRGGTKPATYNPVVTLYGVAGHTRAEPSQHRPSVTATGWLPLYHRCAEILTVSPPLVKERLTFGDRRCRLAYRYINYCNPLHCGRAALPHTRLQTTLDRRYKVSERSQLIKRST